MAYALISCVKRKLSRRCPAREMYSASVLFRKAYGYCKSRGLTVLILSTKYGLIVPETYIEPYNETLNGQPRRRVREWAAGVSAGLHELLPPGSSVELHAGRNYTCFLDLSPYQVSDPLHGLRIGRKLQWYTEQLK